MKRTGIIIAFIFLLATSSPGDEKAVSFTVAGGMTRLTPHDLNDFLQSYAYDYTHAVDPSYYLITDGSQRLESLSPKLGRSLEFEITLLVRAAPRIFLTFGSGFISAGLESHPLVRAYSDLEVKLARTDKIRAIPLKVGVLYSWPLTRRLRIRPHISLDAYISSFKETGAEERKDLELNRHLALDEWDIRTTAFSWGSTWGASLDLSLSGAAALFLDAGYRRARLSGFRGTETRFDNGVTESERDFRLLRFECHPEGYSYLNLPMACACAPLDVVRDAVLDLSGPYLKCGLRLSL